MAPFTTAQVSRRLASSLPHGMTSPRQPAPQREPRVAHAVAHAARLVWHAAPRLLLSVLAIDAVSGLGVGVQLWVASRVLGELVAGAGTGTIPPTVIRDLLILLAVLTLTSTLSAARSDLQALLAELTGRHARDRILEVATTVDLAAFDSPGFYDQLQRAQSAALSRPSALALDVTTLASTLSGALGVLVSLAVLQPWLLPFALIAVIPHWVATRKNSQTSYRFGFEMTADDRQRSYLASLLTTKSAAQEVRAFDAAGFIRSRYNRLYDQRIARVQAVTTERVKRSVLASMAQSSLWVLILAALFALLLTHRTTVAVATTSVLALQQLSARLQTMTRSSGTLQQNALFLDDLSTFLATPTEVPDASTSPVWSPTPAPFDTVRLDRVSFTYPGAAAPALREVCLTINRGEVIGLVGENGSGKTTLVKLLCQLYRPTEGTMLWSGTDTSTYDPRALRRMIAVLFQDYVHYSLTAADNIAVGHHTLAEDPEAISGAARAAGIHPLLSDLPEGYHTILGREFYGGQELSVGQWQRLALARAFLRDAPFIILDEPTAALDPRAEHQVFERMRELAAGRTVLLISHRVSSMRAVDRVYVLGHGRIVETGSHEQLIADRGLYADLYTLQATSFEQGLVPGQKPAD